MITTPLHILDFEGNTRIGVLEYGIVTLVGKNILDVTTRLCRGEGRVAPADTRLHGIRNQDLSDVDPLEKDWLYFSGCRRTGLFGAHHALIEDTLLRQVWPYPGPVPDFLNEGETQEDWGPWVDTRRLYEYLFPDLESYQLTDLIRTFRLETSLAGLVERHCPPGRRKPHCALYDALASALLVLQIYELPGYETVDLWWLAYHSASSHKTREDWSQGELF